MKIIKKKKNILNFLSKFVDKFKFKLYIYIYMYVCMFMYMYIVLVTRVMYRFD